MIAGDYNFDSFIENDTNNFALAACKSFAKDPHSYNPLWLYGKAGCGKTHLLCAVYNELIKKQGVSTLFIRAKDATDLLIGYIHGKKSDWLCLESCDVLIMDNLEYFIGRPSILEEFTALILEKVSNGQSVIFATDCAPIHIEYLYDELMKKGGNSLVADIGTASTDLKIRYIRNFMSEYRFDITNDALAFIIKNYKTIPQIRGLLTTASFYSLKFEKTVDIDWILTRGN